MWRKDSGGGPEREQLLKPNRETLDTNTAPPGCRANLFPPLFGLLSSAEVSSQVDFCSFPPGTSQQSTHLALTYGEVSVAQGRQPPDVVVQEVFGFRHHAVAPQEEVGEHGVDHPEPAHTRLLS